jgi:predicted site-specific integrase-resolvase
MDHPEVVETYTITEAAAAIGVGVNTLRRWVDADKFPGPVLEETVHRYRVYSRGELEAAHRVLARHALSFSYLSSHDRHVIEDIHQAVHGYRAQFI